MAAKFEYETQRIAKGIIWATGCTMGSYFTTPCNNRGQMQVTKGVLLLREHFFKRSVKTTLDALFVPCPKLFS